MRFLIHLAVAIQLLTASAACAKSPRLFTAQDMLDLRRATDPQIRPEGGAVAYVRLTGDIMSAFLVAACRQLFRACAVGSSAPGRLAE